MPAQGKAVLIGNETNLSSVLLSDKQQLTL